MTSNAEASVSSVAIQYNTTYNSYEGTVFFHYVRHFRDYPLLENHKNGSFINTRFKKKDSTKAEIAIQRSCDLIWMEAKWVIKRKT